MTAATPGSAELLALADWLVKQREYYERSMANKDAVIGAHIERLKGWENAARLAAKPAEEVREALRNAMNRLSRSGLILNDDENFEYLADAVSTALSTTGAPKP